MYKIIFICFCSLYLYACFPSGSYSNNQKYVGFASMTKIQEYVSVTGEAVKNFQDPKSLASFFVVPNNSSYSWFYVETPSTLNSKEKYTIKETNYGKNGLYLPEKFFYDSKSVLNITDNIQSSKYFFINSKTIMFIHDYQISYEPNVLNDVVILQYADEKISKYYLSSFSNSYKDLEDFINSKLSFSSLFKIKSICQGDTSNELNIFGWNEDNGYIIKLSNLNSLATSKTFNVDTLSVTVANTYVLSFFDSFFNHENYNSEMFIEKILNKNIYIISYISTGYELTYNNIVLLENTNSSYSISQEILGGRVVTSTRLENYDKEEGYISTFVFKKYDSYIIGNLYYDKSKNKFYNIDFKDIDIKFFLTENESISLVFQSTNKKNITINGEAYTSFYGKVFKDDNCKYILKNILLN